ncbi:MAG: 30S ribosomal protein S7 [Bacilli bacterium]|nr:30S ribosomal protein S7 [Bacilli bacterium]
MRKRHVFSRDVLADPIYNSKVVTKLINRVMLDGKRGKAQTIVYKAFDMVQERTNENSNDVFTKAIENITPAIEVKSRRVGGANVQVPVEVNATRGEALALRWLVGAARTRGGKSMAEKLANEIIDASNETGAAFKKKEDVHRMAEANKAFAHYKW